MDILNKIKRLVIARKIIFSQKAVTERLCDQLSVEDIVESIANANAIKKTIRSKSNIKKNRYEYLHIIESPNYSGLWIYTKGIIRKLDNEEEVFYVIISSKLTE